MKLSLPTPPLAKELTRQPQNSAVFNIIDSGQIEFSQALSLQKNILQQIIFRQAPDTLIFCQHPAVITLGRLAKNENLLVSPDFLKQQGIGLFSAERGGDITCHEPGQLVVYPLINLAGYRKDLKWYLNNLEEVVIDFLRYFGIKGIRRPGLTGVWVREGKIASIGIAVKHWVSYHGIAVNINNRLEIFSLVRPCGLDAQMVSLQGLCKNKIDFAEAKRIMQNSFENVFKRGYSQ